MNKALGREAKTLKLQKRQRVLRVSKKSEQTKWENDVQRGELRDAEHSFLPEWKLAPRKDYFTLIQILDTLTQRS